MEVVNLLKEEIKRIASEENINVPKLNEYTRIYERLRAFDTTTVAQVGVAVGNQNYMFDTPGIPMMQGRPRDNEIGNMLDIFKEIVYDMNKPKGRHEIDDYMFWVRFLKDVREDITGCWDWENNKDEIIEELDKLMAEVSIRTMHLMKKQLLENVEKETKEMEKELKNKSVVEEQKRLLPVMV